MFKSGKGHYVSAYSTLDDMTTTGYYAPNGKIVPEKHLAVKFDHLRDILGFVEHHSISLNEKCFISYVLIKDKVNNKRRSCLVTDS